MKKILLVILFALSLLLPVSGIFTPVHAQTPTPSAPCSDPSNSSCYPAGQYRVGDWITDPDVTFVGKSAARSGQFLDWTLQNYQWICVKRDNDRFTCDNSTNPLTTFWKEVVFGVVAPVFLLIVIITAFILIITRGRSITFRKFIPRFVGIVLLVSLSFAVFSFVYETGDIVQGFFLKNTTGYDKTKQIDIRPTTDDGLTNQNYNNPYINQRNLLFVGFNYNQFAGIRRFGDIYDESVFITLLLTKLTAVTYYTMTGVLLIRKIILWFFIIVSPILPLLFFYSPVRNTAKIWIGELLRWLLYGPLFAMLLAGLVTLWGNKAVTGNQSPVPLAFDRSHEKGIAENYDFTEKNFPTAVNILLGGPGESVCFVPGTCANTVNYIDTFALYVVSLLMLWVVILLPFVLLQIFLDYINNINWNESWLSKQMLNTQQVFGPGKNPPVAPPPSPIRSTGMARQIPYERGASTNAGVPAKAHVTVPAQADTEVLRLTNLSVPSMRDIARYETSRISNNMTSRQEITTVKETLERISDTNSNTSTIEKEHFERVREKLFQESQQGNVTATSILKAANAVAPGSVPNTTRQVATVLSHIAKPESIVSTMEKQRYTDLQKEVVSEQQRGNPLAVQIVEAEKSGDIKKVEAVKDKLEVAQKQGDRLATKVLSEVKKQEEHAKAIAPAFPTQNRVQQVSLDDYEAVKKMWQENYKKLNIPTDLATKGVNRKQWIQDDIQNISQAISLLSNIDQQKVSEGMKMVSTILPFLLIGGFSQTEVIAYLKAKQEAAKSVLEDVNEQEEEENTLVDTKTQAVEKPQEMHLEAQREFTDDEKPTQGN